MNVFNCSACFSKTPNHPTLPATIRVGTAHRPGVAPERWLNAQTGLPNVYSRVSSFKSDERRYIRLRPLRARIKRLVAALVELIPELKQQMDGVNAPHGTAGNALKIKDNILLREDALVVHLNLDPVPR